MESKSLKMNSIEKYFDKNNSSTIVENKENATESTDLQNDGNVNVSEQTAVIGTDLQRNESEKIECVSAALNVEITNSEIFMDTVNENENIECVSAAPNVEITNTKIFTDMENSAGSPTQISDICEAEKTSSKRERSNILSSSSESPASKKHIRESEDDCLKLPEDAPFWVEILFKSIDRMSAKLEDIGITCDTLKSDVDTKLATLKAETDKKVRDLADQFIKASNDNSKQIQDLTDSVNYISGKYEDQKKIDDILIGKIDNLNKRQQTLKEKCHAYEDLIVKQADQIDSLEQYGRRNCLLLHGIPEKKDENTDTVFIETVTNHLGVTFQPSDLDRSHRLGSKKDNRPRPIIVKFTRYNQRKVAFNLKKKFKGTQIILTESLTRNRVIMLESAKKKFGKHNAWSMDGEIYADDGKNVIYVKDYFKHKVEFT